MRMKNIKLKYVHEKSVRKRSNTISDYNTDSTQIPKSKTYSSYTRSYRLQI